MIARHNGEQKLAEVVARALLVALPFAIGLSLVIGAILECPRSTTCHRLECSRSAHHVGQLGRTCPDLGLDHPFDKLAAIANGMLDEIEVLVTEMAGSAMR